MRSPWRQSLKALCTLWGCFIVPYSFFFTCYFVLLQPLNKAWNSYQEWQDLACSSKNDTFKIQALQSKSGNCVLLSYLCLCLFWILPTQQMLPARVPLPCCIYSSLECSPWAFSLRNPSFHLSALYSCSAICRPLISALASELMTVPAGTPARLAEVMRAEELYKSPLLRAVPGVADPLLINSPDSFWLYLSHH